MWTNPSAFNGATIYTMPSFKLRSLDLTMGTTVSSSTNPWTHQRQNYDWMADWWEADVSLPPLTTAQVGAWMAFLSQLRGQIGIFFLGHPLYASPFGSALGIPLVNASSQTGRVLNTKGWTPSSNGVLLPGDHFQVGVRLHMVQNIVSSDSLGHASMSIFPAIRESPVDGAPLNLASPQGLFALNVNTVQVSSTELKTWGLQFHCVEAL